MTDIIWEVPIYCCSEKEWIAVKKNYLDSIPGLTNERRIEMDQHFITTVAGQWRYNWRIGYLTLQLDRLGALRVMLSKSISRRISTKAPTKKPIYDFGGNNQVADISIKSSYSNSQIYQEICTAFKSYHTTFYVDLTMFEKCGPYVNWRELLKYDK